ncbi:M20 family metallo-hydrolase [Rhodobacter sp. 24-YEA-8]|uniref:M20 family metallo-hydrolase n=1 Tax=Rhodobacter sp. 24-YEA-8 TaxID=1884310 RepID=UPI00089CDE7E|nr:M20 family metallo-hydrolase [Rhodobacter sp. 24-YEA-8]SED46006.1 N-carbamoyl-L-amino-acid hydrolase [Rhodobacter sp. 24-YEA-8]
MSNLNINGERLWQSLMETALVGGTPDGGIARLTLGADDARIRQWLADQTAALGMELVVDEVGNMFATLPGRNPDLAPIAMGSHLDTQPTGGKFDGVLGVLGGLEVLRTLKDAGFRTEAPLMLVNWTNEEGSRFSPAMLGSGVWAGVYSRADADARQDANGESFGSALDQIGWRGEAKAGSQTFAAMFELHIEQGPILEAEGKEIGIVTGVQGLRWFEARLTGRAAHTGSTPMSMRKNALLGAAQVTLAVDAIGHAHAPNAVATVGFLEVSPNSNNVIPGEVNFTVDLRHPDDAVLEAMEAELRAAFTGAAATIGLLADLRRISKVDAVRFDADCIASVRAGVARSRISSREIISGAGHDAVHTAAVAPTVMIFVPSEGGLSHNPAESTSQAECAAGVQVLLDAVLAHDRLLADCRKA